MWIIAPPAVSKAGSPPKKLELPVKNLVLSIGIASALLLAACGKKEEAAPAPESQAPAATPPPATAPSTTTPATGTTPTDPAQPAPAEQPATEQPKQ
jgi:hypothetical protein